MAQQLTMQDLVDYRAFLELQKDDFVLDPEEEKRKQEVEKKKRIKEKIRKMAEIESKQKPRRLR